jgi:predicted O-methyltransferase YrrM
VNLVRVRATPRRAYRSVRITRKAVVGLGAVQKHSELAPFLTLVLKMQPRSVLEIGRGNGGTLWALCQAAADDARIVSLDLPEGPYGGRAATPEVLSSLEKYARSRQELLLIQGDSRDPATLEAVRQQVGSLDLLFIDGDHTYQGVRSDFDMYSPLMRAGGIVAFHDILHHDNQPDLEVDRFWSELPGEKREIVSPSELRHGGRWAGIGLLHV